MTQPQARIYQTVRPWNLVRGPIAGLNQGGYTVCARSHRGRKDEEMEHEHPKLEPGFVRSRLRCRARAVYSSSSGARRRSALEGPKLAATACALLAGLALADCGGVTPPDVAGSYYGFVSGARPSKTTYTSSDAPFMKLTLKSDHTYSMDVAMAERPFTGNWTRSDDQVTLLISGRAFVEFQIAGPDELKPVSKERRRNIPGSLWRMPVAWERGLEKQAAVDKTVDAARELAQAILMEADTWRRPLPKTQKELERRLRRTVRKGGAFQGFTYTYRRAKLPPARLRARTQLGFVVGPGGRAILYADGDTRWQPD